MKLPCTLKLRHTGSDTKGGGVGPMVTDNLSCTLAAAVQDQTLFTGGGNRLSAKTISGGTFDWRRPHVSYAIARRKPHHGML